MSVLCNLAPGKFINHPVFYISDSSSDFSDQFPQNSQQSQKISNDFDDTFLTESESFISASDEIIFDSSDPYGQINPQIIPDHSISEEENSISSFTTSNQSIQKQKQSKLLLHSSSTSNNSIQKQTKSKLLLHSSSTDEENRIDTYESDFDTSSFISSNSSQAVTVYHTLKKQTNNKKIADSIDLNDTDGYSEYEEDIENSSDRRFIASESQENEDISFYRRLDMTQTWKKTKQKKKFSESSDLSDSSF